MKSPFFECFLTGLWNRRGQSGWARGYRLGRIALVLKRNYWRDFYNGADSVKVHSAELLWANKNPGVIAKTLLKWEREIV